MDLDKNYIIHELEKQVSGILKQKYLPDERPIESMFQVIHEPPFEEKISWEIFKTSNQENTDYFFLVKSSWDKVQDCNKLDIHLATLKAKYNKGLIKPTIKREKMYIEKEIVDDMLKQLSKVRVSPIPSKINGGFDGTTYELRVNSIYNNCCFRWWEEGPDSWNELTEKVAKILLQFSNITKID